MSREVPKFSAAGRELRTNMPASQPFDRRIPDVDIIAGGEIQSPQPAGEGASPAGVLPPSPNARTCQ
jgi:hypothetical protein